MKSAPDMFESMKSTFLTANKLKSRLRRYWGTTWKYDPELGYNVEVLNKKMIIYPGTHSKRVRMIANTFGMWHDIKDEKFKDIDKYWLFLNYKKDKNRVDEDREIFINKVNLNLHLNEPFEIRMGIKDPADPKKFNTMTKQELLDYAVDNMGKESYTKVQMVVESDTITRVAVGNYAFIEGAEEYFNVEVVEAVVTPVYVPAVSRKESRTRKAIPAHYTSSIGIRVSITQTASIQAESEFADNLYEDKDLYREKYRDAVIASPEDTPIDADFDLDALFLENDEYSNKTNQKWLDGQLRMSTFNSQVYNRNDFMKLVGRTIDSDYKVKEQGGGLFSGFLGIILVIVIIVAAVLTGGAAAAAAGGWGTAAGFAAGMGLASLTLTFGQIALAKGGADNGLMQSYGKVVQVVSIVSMVSGVYALIASIGNSLAAAYQEGIKAGMSTTAATANAVYATARNAIVSSVSTTAVGTSAMAQGAAAAGATLTPAASAAAAVGEISKPIATVAWNKVISMGTKVITTIVKMIEKSRMKDASREINKLSDELARTEQQLEEESDGNPNIAFGYIEWSTKNLKADNHQYEIDYKYEGTWNNVGRASFFATGLNIRDKEYEHSKGVERDMLG